MNENLDLHQKQDPLNVDNKHYIVTTRKFEGYYSLKRNRGQGRVESIYV